MAMNRREIVKASTSVGVLSLLSGPAMAAETKFPDGFLWGAATAGHQTEGNDTNSDFWLIENIKPTLFAEPVRDACDSFARWNEDFDLVKSLGLNTYRFSIEWSRIEPEPAQFLIAMLDHYKWMIDGCRSRGSRVAGRRHLQSLDGSELVRRPGGWTATDSADLFARFCDRAARHVAGGISRAITLNEPQGLLIAHHMVPEGAKRAQAAMMAEAGRVTGSKRYVGGPSFIEGEEIKPNLLRAHRAAFAAIKAARGDLPCGFSLAVLDEQAVGENSLRDAMRQRFYGAWLETARKDDFIGIQNYSRRRWDAKGVVDPEKDAPRDQMDAEVYPASLANCARYVHKATGRPIFVTEHGIGTENDEQRARLIPLALGHLRKAMHDGVPVIDYFHWSLLDNYEWASGYKPKYGLATVDLVTFKRTAKQSAHVLGDIARRNALTI